MIILDNSNDLIIKALSENVEKKKEEVPKESPWKILKEWFTDNNPDSKLPLYVIKALNVRSILMMFCNFYEITIYLNKYFNNMGLYYLDPLEFYKFLKIEIVQKHMIDKYSFGYIKSEKLDKSLNEIRNKFPFLKRQEISDMLEYGKSEDDYENLLESLGFHELTIKKVRKGKKKEVVKKEDVKVEKNNKIETFSDWKLQFHFG